MSARGTLRTAAVALVPLAGATGVAAAHVKYVTEGGESVDVARFLMGALSNPLALLLLGGGGVATVVAALVYLLIRPARADVAVFRETMASYRDLLPWLLRLSVGLPLVGAGFSGYLFSPAVTPGTPVVVRLFGITAGFLLLFGLGTRLVAGVGFLGYLVGTVRFPEALLAFEYVPGFLAIVLVGGGEPSADDVIATVAADERTLYSRLDPFYRSIAVPFVERVEPYRRLVPTVLRAGVGLSFIYLGVTQKLMDPGDALAVVAKYDLTAVVPVPPELWVVGAGLTEALVGLALVAGLFTRAFAAISIGMFTLTLFGLPDDPVLAHVSLFGLVSALMITGAGPYSLDRWLAETDVVSTGRAAPAD